MFNRNKTLLKLINILLIVYWCEICLVNCADLLKFWEPDPELDARRAVENHQKNRNKIEIYEKPLRNHHGLPIDIKDDDSQTEIYHSRGRYKTDINAHRSRTKDEEEPHRSQSKDKKYSRDEKYTRRAQPWLRPQSHTDASSEITKKIKPKHSKRKYRRDSVPYESTRMTPMYLMQVTNEEKTITKKDRSYKKYLSPFDIAEQMKEINEKFPEVNVTQEIIGRTVEYNNIVLLKITARKSEVGRYFRAEDTKYIDEGQDKKIVFIVHGLSVMGMYHLNCLDEIEQFFILLSYYFAHLDKFDIFLIPMANPDGYLRSRTNKWNKNMSPQNACPGVNLDRNFDVAWNVSQDMSSCNQLYPGPNAFSEIETRAIRDVFHHYSHKIIAYFHVHSGTYDFRVFKGDAILYPRGYTDLQTDDDKYIDLKGEVDEAMKNASFQMMSVSVDTLFNWYTKISGSSVDYASTVYGIPYAMELVMQIYEYDAFETDHLFRFDYLALTEIWKRVIDVIFNNIWRNTHTNNENK